MSVRITPVVVYESSSRFPTSLAEAELRADQRKSAECPYLRGGFWIWVLFRRYGAANQLSKTASKGIFGVIYLFLKFF